MLSIGYLKGSYMNCLELAQLLNNHPYGEKIPLELLNAARENNLVIVYGASDDLIEFDGAITDEGGCYNGGHIEFDKDGIVPSKDDIDTCDYDNCIEHYLRTQKCWSIEAVWCSPDQPAWTYIFDHGSSPFVIMEGSEAYCIGLVFSVEDL